MAQLVRAPPCHGGGREFESHLGRLRGLSSAGRASALQAEGHRFEPYRPHFFNLICRSGGTGRRPGLKIPWVVIPVPVRFRSAARFKRLQILCFREFGVFLYKCCTNYDNLLTISWFLFLYYEIICYILWRKTSKGGQTNWT